MTLSIAAWFLPAFSMEGITMTAGALECEVDIYIYNDRDMDGYPDIYEEGDVEGYEEVSTGMGYAALPIDHVTLNRFKPGDYYYFRLDVMNNGGVPGKLYVNITFPGAHIELSKIISYQMTERIAPAVLTPESKNANRSTIFEQPSFYFGENFLVGAGSLESIYFNLRMDPLEQPNTEWQKMAFSNIQITAILEQQSVD